MLGDVGGGGLYFGGRELYLSMTVEAMVSGSEIDDTIDEVEDLQCLDVYLGEVTDVV